MPFSDEFAIGTTSSSSSLEPSWSSQAPMTSEGFIESISISPSLETSAADWNIEALKRSSSFERLSPLVSNELKL